MKNLIIFCALYSTNIFAQVICNSISKNPIENVNIVSNKNKGTITNEQGRFTFDYFENFKSLTFSHLTYQTKKINRKDIMQLDTIFLQPAIVNLDAIVLNTFNAKDTLIKAIKRIPLNYTFKAFNLSGFYRESVVEDTKGVAMTEVSFLTYVNTKNNKQTYNTKIIKGRRTENYTTFNLEIYGGVFRIIQVSDLVRQKRRIFDTKNLLKYNFNYGGSIYNSENKTYIINYKPSDDDIYNNRKGKIFIDANTLAIVQVTVKSDKNKIKKIIDKLFNKPAKQKKAIYMRLDSDGIVNYKKYKGKYYLSFINITDSFKGVFNDLSHNYKLNGKLIVTQVNTTEPKKIKTNYNVKKDFNKQVKKIPKLAYWNENNTLLFSKKERQILKDIKNVFK